MLGWLRSSGSRPREDTETYPIVSALNRRLASLEVSFHAMSQTISQLRRVVEVDSASTADLTHLESAIAALLGLTKRNTEMILRLNEQVKQIDRLRAQGAEDKGIFQRDATTGLAETELAVLRLIQIHGPQLSRDIMAKIGRSREHTGRLLKSLYARDYLDRSSNIVPFRYRLTGQTIRESAVTAQEESSVHG